MSSKVQPLHLSESVALRFTNTVSGVADEGSVLAFQKRKLSQVFFLYCSANGFSIGRIDKGHAATFETGTGEAGAVDAGQLGEDIV